VSEQDLDRRVISLLDAAAVPHMIAGSIASTFYGRARMTCAVDIVIDPTATTLRAFLASLGADDYYVDRDVAEDALRRRGQFNVVDMATGWKLDFIIRKARPFSIEEFARRQEVELEVCAPSWPRRKTSSSPSSSGAGWANPNASSATSRGSSRCVAPRSTSPTSIAGRPTSVSPTTGGPCMLRRVAEREGEDGRGRRSGKPAALGSDAAA
jgi:hypothetical protein